MSKNSLRDLQTEVLRNIQFNANVDSDLRRALAHYRDALENRDGIYQADEIAGHRLKLAAIGLRLSQQTIPSLEQISAEMLEAAGVHAVREACKPTRALSGKEVPSEFTLPAPFAGVVDRARAAFSSLAAR